MVDNRKAVRLRRKADMMFAQSEIHGFRTVHSLRQIIFAPLGELHLLAYELNLNTRF
ncbi:hypothetical protein SIAM614_25746 [Stappia aggregata IAM 12614]|uniref:Uncharacterized protein n=1 Tax=Roseibium aggregatum (strain ATCC 25650 / DSM 13394 / JCM 20685 / NBRC 16684 / NCIMB 2208 / IAM 12614 / B1) TaxID=384765 RepID=A0NZN5_ROSAI|nr:hypothetical protein SIAM614_25746 [Stappia aggregata IAM 12614] [Roseibium aggregatum IAM 12614]